METYRAFLWALIPYKHRLPGQNLHGMSENLFSASSVKHSPPKVVFLWNHCLMTQDFTLSQNSTGPIQLCAIVALSLCQCFLGSLLLTFQSYSWNQAQHVSGGMNRLQTDFRRKQQLYPRWSYFYIHQNNTNTAPRQEAHTCRTLHGRWRGSRVRGRSWDALHSGNCVFISLLGGITACRFSMLHLGLWVRRPSRKRWEPEQKLRNATCGSWAISLNSWKEISSLIVQAPSCRSLSFPLSSPSSGLESSLGV